MPGRKRNPLHLLLPSAVAATALAWCPWSGAAEWRITPSLRLQETYTDNVNLAPDDLKRSDYITEISPGVTVTGMGPNLQFNLAYAMQNLAYAREDDSFRTNHLLSSDLRARLFWTVFLDAGASISRQNTSAFGPQATDNINVDGDRTEVQTYRISPYLRHRFGTTAETQLRYTHDSVDASRTGSDGFNSADQLDSTGNAVMLNLKSGPAFGRLGWLLQHDRQEIDEEDAITAGSSDVTRTIGGLRYLLSQEWSIYASTGYEKYEYISIDEEPRGSLWTTGFTWTPSERTSIDAAVGRRFFGNTFSLASSHRYRLSAWTLNYSEDISASRNGFLLPATIDTPGFLDKLWTTAIPDPVARKEAVNTFMRDSDLPASLAEPTRTISNRFYLEKRLQGSMGLHGVRNTIVFTLFRARREAQDRLAVPVAALGLSDDEQNLRQSGGGVSWYWRFSPRTYANLGATYTRSRSLATSRRDEQGTVSVALHRQFRPRLDGRIELRRLEQQSNQRSDDIRENAIMVSLAMRF